MNVRICHSPDSSYDANQKPCNKRTQIRCRLAPTMCRTCLWLICRSGWRTIINTPLSYLVQRLSCVKTAAIERSMQENRTKIYASVSIKCSHLTSIQASWHGSMSSCSQPTTNAACWNTLTFRWAGWVTGLHMPVVIIWHECLELRGFEATYLGTFGGISHQHHSCSPFGTCLVCRIYGST